MQLKIHIIKPVLTIGLLLFIVLLFLTLAITKTINANWLGMTFQPNPKGYGIEILDIKANRLKSKFSAGDIIVAFRNQDVGTVPLDSDSVGPRTRIYTRDFVKPYRDFLKNETRLHKILQSPSLHVVLINGKSISVRTYKRPLSAIPLNFWIQLASAIIALIIGYKVYAAKGDQDATYHYLAAILGFFIMACCWAIIMNRPIAIHGDLYRALVITSHFGIALFISGLLSFVWCYPRKLQPQWMPYLIYLSYFIFWTIDSLHLLDSLAFSFYSPMFFAFAFATVFATLQWKATEKLPADRTVLKWIFFFIYTSSSFILFFVFIPHTLTGFAIVSPNIEYGLILFICIGLAFAITRYRMVNLEFWWPIMWGGYFSITVGALIYFIIITSVELDSVLSLSVALLCGAITFYPFRQWVKSRLKTAPQNELDKYLPTLIDLLFTARSTVSLSMQWELILTRIFNPISLTSRKNPVHEVQIADNGVVLRVPDFQPEYAIELAYSNQGKRLFVNADVELAQTMYQLTRKAIDLNEARNKGAAEERERIVRDLHDDVGAKLITIIHRAENSQVADLCRSALQDIRDIMSYLGGGMYSVPAMLADWRNELVNRCQAAKILLHWEQSEVIPLVDIDSRTRMNLTRVYRETITNSIKHGEPDNIEISATYTDGVLSFIITDDGNATDITKFTKGRGLYNMRERIQEINGTISWSQNKPHGCITQVCLQIINKEQL